jgi:hypothetical protein
MSTQKFYPTGHEEREGVISLERPIENDEINKKVNLVSLTKDISNEIKDEIIGYLSQENQMFSGNYTLLKNEDIDKFTKLDMIGVLMRGGQKNTLLGTIFSIPFPIKCHFKNKNENKNENTEILVHGCTSFLNVHSKLRGHGMAKLLIGKLLQVGYERNIYCGYQITSFAASPTSIKINMWYRPLNMLRSLELGFVFPHFNEIGHFHENRIKYACRKPKGFNINQITQSTILKAYNFYVNIQNNESITNKRFIYWPNEEEFIKWTKIFETTYLVTNKENKDIVGLFTYKPFYCRMSDTHIEARLCLPLLVVCKGHYNSITLQSLIYMASQQCYDVLYCYQLGDLNRDCLTENSCISTTNPSWFTLYNNYMKLQPEEISVPLF